jgi:hypothetical protein
MWKNFPAPGVQEIHSCSITVMQKKNSFIVDPESEKLTKRTP